MNYCNNCGVELDINMNYCPLCGLLVGEKKSAEEALKRERTIFKDKILSEINNLTSFQKRKLFWEISGIILFSGIIITLIINFIISKNIVWAKYNLVISLSVFANISFFTIWKNRPLLRVLGSFVSTAVLLLLLDLISHNIGWATKLGIPILVSLYVLLMGILWIIRISNQNGFNILAIIFIAIGIFLMCIEVVVSLYLNIEIRLSWSIIAASSMIPVSALLFFVHYRLKTGVDLRRFFNI